MTCDKAGSGKLNILKLFKLFKFNLFKMLVDES